MKRIFVFLAMLILQSNAWAQFNLTMLGHLPYPSNTCAGIWHYVDSISNEYALVGVNDRLAIVDVTNASNPVEILSVPALTGQVSLWREVKTYGKYAYAVSEGGGGMIIVNLSYLPDSVQYKHWYGDGVISNQLNSAHTIAVTDGFAYIFGTGGGLANGGAVIADLSDPWNPVYTGQYNQNYIHDGFIRNDTLWAGEIYAGQFSVIDVSNKSNPVLLATQVTPGQFCHNAWLTDDSRFVFTTDEINGEPLGSFDVTSLSNIKLVDEYYTDSMPGEEVHNVRVLNDFLINPSYGSQLTICDGARPDNIIEIASYPTGSFLCWDASPYLPSGHIIAADVDGGVYVFEPNYIRACYLEGTVTDSISLLPLNNTSVRIQPIDKRTKSNIIGEYKTGNATAGTYDVEFRKQGYKSKVFPGVTLANGQLTQLDAQLSPFILSGTVTNQQNGFPVPGAEVYANDGDNVALAISDQNGNFSFTTLSSGIIEVTATKWGFVSFCQTINTDGSVPLQIAMAPGYYDDFITDLGWTVNSTASAGLWERGVPVATNLGAFPLNPGFDVAGDCGNIAFVTGNGGGSPSTDNVDNGFTELVSPIFDLSTYADPYVNYSRWFSIPANVPAGSRDSMFISISDGITTTLLETIDINSPGTGSWVNTGIRLLNFITPANGLKLHVFISDKIGTGNYLEAGFDQFVITEGTQGVQEVKENEIFSIYPNPGDGTFRMKLTLDPESVNMTVKVVDLTGRTVYQYDWQNNPDYFYGNKELAPGIYLVSVITKDKIIGTSRYVVYH